MAQAGYTPIQLYLSTTASAVPSAVNLANGELAINITDGKLFYKDNGGVVQVLATKGAGTIGGSNTQVQYNNAGALAGSANLTFDGTTLTAAGLAGPHNGTVGATTPNTGAFTTLSASSTVSGAGFSAYLASPPAIGGTAANTGAFTTLAASGAVTLSGGTANGVAYLNGSKVLTTGSALTFDGTNLGVGVASPGYGVDLRGASGVGIQIFETSTGNNNRLILTQQATVSTYNSTFSTGSGAHAWQLGGSEQMRLTSTGLGIGTSTLQGKLTVQGDIYTRGGGVYYVQNGDNTNNYYLQNSGATGAANGNLNFVQGGVAVRATLDSGGNFNLLAGNIYTTTTSGIFFTGTVGNFANGIYAVGGNNVAISANGSERLRVNTSGYLLVGTTSSDPISAQVNGLSIRGAVGDILASAGDTPAIQIARRGSDGGVIQFYKNTTAVGSISTTSVLTTYNTTSDYRLKNVIGAVVDAGSRIDALEPVEYEWKSEGSRTRGFLAHKFQEVYPQSVSGEKDAVDADGKPVYQNMQAGTSEVIADLVAEIQSLRKRLAAAGIA